MSLSNYPNLPIAYHKYYGRLFNSKRDIDQNRYAKFIANISSRNTIRSSINITYPENLPISTKVDELKKLILGNQVIIVAAETGSGKTTQLPKILIDLGLCDYGIIGHTQPRRIAAKTISSRLAYELDNPNAVGSKIRFSDKTSEHNLVKIMTDGVLLQEIQRDRLLLQYQVLIIDEAHERSLNIDFILGYIKQILPMRPDLKIIITSATLDNVGFSQFFENSVGIKVEGKTYPIDILYQEPTEEEHLDLSIYRAIESCFSIELGSVLVFLPGEREIKQVERYLSRTNLNRFNILPLYSRQQDSAQQLIFQNNGLVKIILATNVAETSLTIPAIKFVIDSGLVKVKRYNSRTKLEQLLVENIAKSNAKQRSGRAGRTSHGMCIRLYSEIQYDNFQEFTDPEVLRSNLANVILQLLYLRLGDPFNFPFVTKPEYKIINDGYRRLTLLSAIDDELNLTDIGHKMAKLPLDANLARIIIEASNNSCINDALIIVCYLSIQDPKESPLEFQAAAKQSHMQFSDPKSDFAAILNLWTWWQEHLLHKKTNKQLIELCYKNFLSLNRLKEWRDLYLQMKQICTELLLCKDIQTNIKAEASYNLLHNSIFSGFLMDIGIKDPSYNHYNSTNSRKILLHPSSLIKPPLAFVSANIIQTSNTYARVNAAIDIKQVAPMLKIFCKFSYSDAAWFKKRGQVVATRNWIFYGLKVNSDIVNYAEIDREIARDIFIRQALVEQELNTIYPFLKHNMVVIDAIEEIEDKLRTSLANLDDVLYEFYDNTLLDRDILDIPSLELWLKTNPKALYLDKNKLINSLTDVKQTEQLYPPTLRFNGLNFNVEYIFDHSRDDDGMNVRIELKYLNQVRYEWFSYLCLGLIREKIMFIFKNIPKMYRINLQPFNEAVNVFLADLDGYDDSLEAKLGKFIQQKLELDSLDISGIELPNHLKCHFTITENGKLVAKGNDLIEIKHNLRDKLARVFADISETVKRKEIQTYTDDLCDITNSVTLQDGKTVAYSAISIQDDGIFLILTESQKTAINLTKQAYISMVKSHMSDLLKLVNLAKNKTIINFNLCVLDIYNITVLSGDMFSLLIRSSIDLTNLPASALEYDQLVSNSRQSFSQNKNTLINLVEALTIEYKEIKTQLQNHTLSVEVMDDLEQLFYPEFLQYINLSIFENYLRYMQAIKIRLNRYSENRTKDTQSSHEITQLYDKLDSLITKHEKSPLGVPMQLYDFYYKIEELKISLFAPSIKTLYTVSAKRLHTELDSYKLY